MNHANSRFTSAFLSTAAYLIFGSWLNYNRYGARGWDLLPHGDAIRDVPYLFKDWVRRVLSSIQGGGSRGGYAAVWLSAYYWDGEMGGNNRKWRICVQTTCHFRSFWNWNNSVGSSGGVPGKEMHQLRVYSEPSARLARRNRILCIISSPISSQDAYSQVARSYGIRYAF